MYDTTLLYVIVLVITYAIVKVERMIVDAVESIVMEVKTKKMISNTVKEAMKEI